MALQSSQFQSARKLACRAIDTPRPLKIICVGAGVSGILAAIHLQKRLKDFELIIFEKNGDLGGTWLENRYPGCACGKQRDPQRHPYGLMQKGGEGKMVPTDNLGQIFHLIVISCRSRPIRLGASTMPRRRRFGITGSEWQTSTKSRNTYASGTRWSKRDGTSPVDSGKSLSQTKQMAPRSQKAPMHYF